MFRCILCCLLLSCATVSSDISSMETAYVRTNWGVVFNKVGVVLNGITKYRHTFAVTIPNMVYRAIQPMPCNSSLLKEAHCESVNALVEQINNAYTAEFEQMRRNIANVVAIIGNVERPLSKRKKRSTSDSPHLSPSFCKDGEQTAAGGGLLATLGKIGSDIFGLPTYDDIKIVDKHICELADTIDINRREIVASNERLSSISGALNNRVSALQHGLQNMNDRITETQRKLTNVAQSIAGDMNELNVRINFIEQAQEAMYLLMGNLERFEHAVVRHLRFASNWLYGINKLLEGYLSLIHI